MKESLSSVGAGSPGVLGAMPTTTSSSYAGHSALLSAFDRFASSVTRVAGSPVAFCAALFTVIA